MTAFDPAPWPYDWPEGEHCWIHGHEPVPAGAYLVCGECHHVYVTAADLVAADAAMRAECELPPCEVRAEDVASCPICSHDF